MKNFFTFLFLLLMSLISYSQSTTLVISQVYGAGGNSGAPLNAQRCGTAQYFQRFSKAWLVYPSNMLLPPARQPEWCGPFTIREHPPGGYFPDPDEQYRYQWCRPACSRSPASPTIAMSATSGKVALVQGTTALSGCPTANVIDKVGYGYLQLF